MRPWLQNHPGAQAGTPLPMWPGGERVMARRPGLTADARLLVAGQGVRAAGYGFTAVLLGALLAARGFSSVQVGVALTALIAGTALASLAVGRFGDRAGRRRSYAVFFAGIAVAGVVVAAGAPLWLLLVVALTGTLSTDVVDNGPATTLEQAMLATEDAGTAVVYGRYNDTVVITIWPSHEVFDAWIATPHCDALTASEVHQAVSYQPITRYETTGGYLNLPGLTTHDPSPPAPRQEPS
jgi:hypothetical protein